MHLKVLERPLSNSNWIVRWVIADDGARSTRLSSVHVVSPVRRKPRVTRTIACLRFKSCSVRSREKISRFTRLLAQFVTELALNRALFPAARRGEREAKGTRRICRAVGLTARRVSRLPIGRRSVGSSPIHIGKPWLPYGGALYI